MHSHGVTSSKTLSCTLLWYVAKNPLCTCEASQTLYKPLVSKSEITSSIASWNERLTVNRWSCSVGRWTFSPSGWSWCFRSLTFICKKVATYGFSYICLICHTTDEPFAKLRQPIAKLRDKLAKDSLQRTLARFSYTVDPLPTPFSQARNPMKDMDKVWHLTVKLVFLLRGLELLWYVCQVKDDCVFT